MNVLGEKIHLITGSSSLHTKPNKLFTKEKVLGCLKISWELGFFSPLLLRIMVFRNILYSVRLFFCFGSKISNLATWVINDGELDANHLE